MLLKIGII